jgi:hypothetical protein
MIRYVQNKISIHTSSIHILTILFYFTRTIFPILSYFFIVSATISLFLLMTKLRWSASFFRAFIIPIITSVFYISGILISGFFNSYVLKELINDLIVLTIFYLFATNNLVGFQVERNKIFKWFLIILFITGSIAIFRTVFLRLGGSIPFEHILFSASDNGVPLVTDKNFYALYFLIGIVLIFYLRFYNEIGNSFYIIANGVSLFNIIFSFSRRAYVVYAIFLVIMLVGLVVFRQRRNVLRMIFQSLSVFLVFLTIAIIVIRVFRIEIYQYEKTNVGITRNLASVNALINPFENKNVFEKKIWLKTEHEFWEKQKSKAKIDSNLFYNSNFSDSTKYWDKYVAPKNDSITHQLISENGDTFLRINRISGKGYWSLIYRGRPIYYYKDVNYTLSFKFRVIKGDGLPFHVGWWALENGKRIYALPKKTEKINDGWNRCTVNYTFKENQINPACFINSQKANTILDIKDIELTSNDTLKRNPFVDQLNVDDQIKTKGNNENNLTDQRSDRYKFALEIWQTKFNWKQKLFGGGFDYLTWYGMEFYDNSSRNDYPHSPVISSFLYSGIIGGLFYLYFLLLVFYYYWKFRKYHFIFLIIYPIVFFFCMISGNSHFSVPLFIFLSCIPFYSKYRNELST